MQKIRYEIDPYNRLIAADARKTKFPRFRKVYDGKFKTGKNNSLTYHIKTPACDSSGVPHQIKFKGKWSLNKNYDLVFTADKSKRQLLKDKFIFKGSIMDVNKNSLFFALTTKTEENKQSIYVLKLEGIWQADRYNRLIFKAERERGRCDILVFTGRWQVNNRYQVVYRYEKAQLIRKRKEVRNLIFKGQWRIKDNLRISYVLDKEMNSGFDFKSSFAVFEAKYIKYEVGIGLSPHKQIIIFFGQWKVKSGKRLTFEVKYKNKKISSFTFAAEVKLTDKDKVSFKLRRQIDKKDTGITLKLSRKLLKANGEVLVEVSGERKEKAVFAGIGKRW